MRQRFVETGLKITLALLLSVFLFPSAGFSAANYGISYGYVPGYSSSTGGYTMSIGDIPWTDLSHVSFFAALANTTTITTTGGVVDPLNNLTTLIAQAHSHSVRCYLTVGGASTDNVWPSGTANCTTFADNIVSTAVADGFDGIDMDCEFPGVSGFPSEADFDTIMNELRSKCNAATPGLAKSGKYPDETNFGLIMYLSPGFDVCGYNFSTLVSDCDWFTLSGYDLNVDTSYNFQGSLVAPVSEAFTTCSPISQELNRDIEAVSGWYNSQGIAYSKMVLGMPMYGRDASNPNPGKSDNDVFTNGTAGTFDTSRDEILWTDGGTTYGMDDSTSYCDKINWSVGKMGMAGIALFDLGQGLPTTANTTLTNIWSDVSGGAACVTVGTNPCAPAACTATATPTATPNCGTLIDNLESGLTENQEGGYWNFYNPGSPLTCNPSPWYPTVNDGLQGSLYGARMYGLTSASNSPSLYTGCGVAPSGLYSVPNGATGIQFVIRMDAGPGGATPTAAQLGIDLTFGTGGSSTYLYTVNIPAAYVGTNTTAGATPVKTGTEYVVDVLFSQFAYSYGTNTPLNTTELYQLAFRPGTYSTNGGLYDFTLDNLYYTCPPTPTFTPTSTFSSTPSKTPTMTFTSTPSSTFTATISNTPTNTVAVTSTFTATPSSTFTKTLTNTFTPTPTNTFTSTITNTFTNTPQSTSTFTNTATKTYTSTITNTFTPTVSSTYTNTVTNTVTFTITNTPTITPTPTLTPTASITNTGTLLPTNTFTVTSTNTATGTFTQTPTLTRTNTALNTSTPTGTASYTSTITNTPNGPTNTFTVTSTNTPTSTGTPTNTSTITNTPNGPTSTPTNTATVTSTSTYTNTATVTDTATQTSTPTNTFTATNSNTFTATPTYTYSSTVTNTPTSTFTLTSTYSSTDTPTSTNSPTKTDTPTVTSTVTLTFTPTSTLTATPTAINNVLYTPPYPNPVTTGPVEIDVTTPGAASIQMEVFTTAFRKIAEHTFTAGSGNSQLGTVTAVQWDLHDKMGMNVADGLYYVRVQVMGRQDAVKIFKVLVLR